MVNGGELMEENKNVPLVFSQDYVDKQLRSINSMLEHRNYALMSGVISVSGDIYRPRRINRTNLRRALSDPYKDTNIDILQQASMVLKATNGIYKRVLNYQSNMHTHDFMIYPMDVDRVKNASKMQKSYMEAAMHVERYNLKDNACWIKERVLEQGELFTYKIEDANGIILQEIPNTFCKITSVENGVSKYAINLKKFNERNILSFPKEIQNLWKRFNNGSIKEKDLIDKNYYELKDNAVAFNLDRFTPKGVPYYCTIFDDLMELEDKKDLKSQSDVIENIKLIHQKFPIDKDTGASLVDFDVIESYHRATKTTLPPTAAVTTNCLDLQVVSMGDASAKLNNTVLSAKDTVFDSAGINAELFNGNKNSNEAIAMGVIGDGLVSKPLNNMIVNWINYEMKKKKFSGITWAIKMLDSTEFNKDKIIKQTKENMAFGGSRTEFLASNGYTPLQAISVLKMESMLGLDELLVPQQTSHTQSGNENGRPKKEDGGSGDDTTSKPLSEN